MQNDRSRHGGALRYVALGDSYTIGTSVRADESWPSQLVVRLASTACPLDLVANLGVNGFTSADVIAAELPRLASLEIEFASILVGVNDVVQRVPPQRYRANAAAILDALVGRLTGRRVLAVATPDYTVTPQGARYGDPARQSDAIKTNNAILAALAADRDIRFVDIRDISEGAASDGSLVAIDGLHPSEAQYALWVDRIAPVVEDLLAG